MSGWGITVGRVGSVAVAALLSGVLPGLAVAQSSAMPASPTYVQTLPEEPQAAAQQVQDGSISGTVVDSDGDAVAGAEIALSGAFGPAKKLVADGEGYFSFIGLPAGDFSLAVSSPGFATQTIALHLTADQQLETPDIALKVAEADTTVDVSMSIHDIAEEQIRIEEKQRLIGILPNWYVTYDWHAAPMSAGQKLKMSARLVVDPTTFLLTGIISGVEQATNAFPGYGQGAEGYGKRYGAGLADSTVGNLLGGAVFPIIFHQDPRYFYKGTGSVWSRALYAISTSVICRGDNGKWQPNYSSLAGDISSALVSNTYYPASNQLTIVSTIEIGVINAAEEGFGNLLQEFIFKHVTPSAQKKAPAPGAPATP